MQSPTNILLDFRTQAVPTPADRVAVALYRMVTTASDRDLRALLAAIRATGVELDPPFVLDGDQPNTRPGASQRESRKQLVDWSLRTAVSKLGRRPSKREYNKWVDSQVDGDRYASATSIHRTYGSWAAALQSLGGPVADITARRLLSCGKRFSIEECRTGIRLFAETLPARRDPRSPADYIAWARGYAKTVGAERIPLSPTPFRRVFGVSWGKLLASPELWKPETTANAHDWLPAGDPQELIAA
jgi:hypothetical protein